jgi:ferritin-like metal-binding protein YciE
MKDHKELLVTWLKDAHAMESNIVKMLEKQSEHLDDLPELKQKIDSHFEESRRHAERVQECLESLGSDTSTLKDGMAKLSGMMGQSGLGATSDEPVKTCIGNIGIEHFEIACYQSLRAAAHECGETQIAAVAEEILAEEKEMATFLESQVEPVTMFQLQAPAHA